MEQSSGHSRPRGLMSYLGSNIPQEGDWLGPTLEKLVLVAFSSSHGWGTGAYFKSAGNQEAEFKLAGNSGSNPRAHMDSCRMNRSGSSFVARNQPEIQCN